MASSRNTFHRDTFNPQNDNGKKCQWRDVCGVMGHTTDYAVTYLAVDMQRRFQSCLGKVATVEFAMVSVEEFLSARVPSSSAEVRGLVVYDIKEVEGVRQ